MFSLFSHQNPFLSFHGCVLIVSNSPATGQTLADFTSRAATAANNVSPNAPGVAPAASGSAGQIGGTTTTDPAAAPPVPTSTKSAASSLARRSWALLIVAAVMVGML